MKSDERIVGSSYIIDFYRQVDMLTQSYSQYICIINELDEKYGKDIKNNSVPEEERSNLMTCVQNMRYYATKSYILYVNIKDSLKLSDEVTVKLDEFNKSFIPNRKVCLDLVLALNSFMIRDIIKNLVDSSNEFLNNIYGGKEEVQQ